MDAFLEHVGPAVSFPKDVPASKALRLQMKRLARLFRGKPGVLIRSLLGEAQFDPELKAAFFDRWIAKRRMAAREIIVAGIAARDLPASTDADVLLDTLYGGLYYRLLIGSAPLTDGYVDAVCDAVLPARK